MIPVGPDRDRRIAELRGIVPCDFWVLTHASRGEYHRDLNVCGHNDGKCMPSVYYPRPYSTDIKFAMELAEEMKASNDSAALFLLRDAWFDWLHPDRESAELSTAISGAYIKWKSEEVE